MLNLPTAPRYRIKGLYEVSPEEETTPSSSPTQMVEPGKLMGRIFRCIRKPHLSDHLYHFDGYHKLARRWPTFNFVHPRRRKIGWIKTTPLHLAPHFGWPRPKHPDAAIKKLLRNYDQQEDEQKTIQLFLDCLDTGDEPNLVNHPLAMGLACHLYAGSAWLRRNRSRLREIVLRSATASYLALASGAFAGDAQGLINRIAANPMLVLELAQNSILRGQLRDAWFAEALVKRPLFHSLYLFMKNQEKAAWELLHKTAESDAVSAGICLGLDPRSKDANIWTKVVGNCSEAMYWSGRIWQAEHDDIEKFKYAPNAVAHLMKDRRWYYAWLRDLEWSDLNAKVTEIWPDPWSIELIADRHMPKNLVTELCCKREMDHKDPIQSAVLLWAQEYVES